MKRAALPLVLVVCLSLVGGQVSGLHMHVDKHGYTGSPHATHVHKGGADGHGHEHETDVNAIDLGAVASKPVLLLVAIALVIVMIFNVCQWLAPEPVLVPVPRGRMRWRPPLRAPPLSPIRSF